MSNNIVVMLKHLDLLESEGLAKTSFTMREEKGVLKSSSPSSLNEERQVQKVAPGAQQSRGRSVPHAYLLPNRFQPSGHTCMSRLFTNSKFPLQKNTFKVSISVFRLQISCYLRFAACTCSHDLKTLCSSPMWPVTVNLTN